MRKRYVVLAVVLILMILGLAAFTDQGLLGLYHRKQEQARLEERLAQLQAENAALRSEIERLQSDPAYLEKVAREELGMVHQDELVFQFKSEPRKTPLHP